jgi:hypothetical protein
MTRTRINRTRNIAVLGLLSLGALAWGLTPPATAPGYAVFLLHSESYPEFSTAMSLGAAHDATTSAGLRYGAHAAAVEQAELMSRRATAGTWRPASPGPLIANDPTYTRTAGEGFTNLSGRVNSFAYDSRHHILYATVGQGGVWKTADLGAHWTSIGNHLPSQPVGSIAYTSAGGRHGTLVVVTGNDVYGGGTGSYGMSVPSNRASSTPPPGQASIAPPTRAHTSPTSSCRPVSPMETRSRQHSHLTARASSAHHTASWPTS